MTLAPLNVRERNSVSGIIGEAACASVRTNNQTCSAPLNSDTATQTSSHPLVEALVRPQTSRPRPPTASSAPRVSRAPEDGLRLSGTHRAASSTVTKAIGTLMKKIARQDEASTSHPPNTGPTAVVSADAPAQVPMAAP